MSLISQERLKELVRYDRDTGLFTRLKTAGPVRAGSIAGCVRPDGYVVFRLEGRLYYAHRLAWFYETGEWPSADHDHIDGDKANNRFSNLREATRSQNNANAPRNRQNTSGQRGVYWSNFRKRWVVRIYRDGKPHHFGCFKDFSDAAAAARDGASRLYGEFAWQPR